MDGWNLEIGNAFFFPKFVSKYFSLFGTKGLRTVFRGFIMGGNGQHEKYKKIKICVPRHEQVATRHVAAERRRYERRRLIYERQPGNKQAIR